MSIEVDGSRQAEPGRLDRLDAVVLLVVTVVAAVRRRGMLPDDGLWFDDSWVAAAAVFGEPSQLLSIGSTQPTFVLALMGIDRLGGGVWAMVLPALVAGVLAPALSVVLARRCGFDRWASALPAAVLAISAIPLTYAGRIKPYTVDVLMTLAVAVVLPSIVGRHWRWVHAVAWVLGAWVVGGISAPMLLVTAVAGGMVFLHAEGDRTIRGVAVAVQGVGQLAFVREVRTRADFEGIDRDIIRFFDPYLDLSLDPRRTLEEIAEHLGRIGEVFPGRGGALGVLLVLACTGGLVVAASFGRTRYERLVGRYMGLLLAAAFVGGVVDVIPFGGSNAEAVSFGGRYNLWMAAPLCFGAAGALHHVVSRIGRARRVVVPALAFGTALVLLAGGLPAGPAYPFPGAASAAAELDSRLGPEDRAILLGPYSYPLHSTVPFEVVLDPRIQVGYALRAVDDERFLTLGPWSPDPNYRELIDDHIAGAHRVLVHGAGPLFADRAFAESVLLAEGFELAATYPHKWHIVWEWRRPSDGAEPGASAPGA